MAADTRELKCVRCGLEVRVNRDSYGIFERMHYVCFHFEFEHMGFDPDEQCDAPGCPSTPFDRRYYDAPTPPKSAAPSDAPRGLLTREPASQDLDAAPRPHGA